MKMHKKEVKGLEIMRLKTQTDYAKISVNAQ
jgi:hypothetical protein